jgi:hypothetical protein
LEKDRTMIRFSTIAANADVLGDDTPLVSEPDATRRQRRSGPERPEHRRGRAAAGGSNGAGRPGKDINAPGFLKDGDGQKPS